MIDNESVCKGIYKVLPMNKRRTFLLQVLTARNVQAKNSACNYVTIAEIKLKTARFCHIINIICYKN
jgi:hypothetical protein